MIQLNTVKPRRQTWRSRSVPQKPTWPRGYGRSMASGNHLGAQGALKLMHHSLGTDPQFVRRFQDEIRALQGLSP